MEKFLGGSPLGVLLKLVVASLIIGVILSFFGLNPQNLYGSFVRLADWVSSLSFDVVNSLFRYVALGALIVVPLWLLARALSVLGSRDQHKKP